MVAPPQEIVDMILDCIDSDEQKCLSEDRCVWWRAMLAHHAFRTISERKLFYKVHLLPSDPDSSRYPELQTLRLRSSPTALPLSTTTSDCVHSLCLERKEKDKAVKRFTVTDPTYASRLYATSLVNLRVLEFHNLDYELLQSPPYYLDENLLACIATLVIKKCSIVNPSALSTFVGQFKNLHCLVIGIGTSMIPHQIYRQEVQEGALPGRSLHYFGFTNPSTSPRRFSFPNPEKTIWQKSLPLAKHATHVILQGYRPYQIGDVALNLQKIEDLRLENSILADEDDISVWDTSDSDFDGFHQLRFLKISTNISDDVPVNPAAILTWWARVFQRASLPKLERVSFVIYWTSRLPGHEQSDIWLEDLWESLMLELCSRYNTLKGVTIHIYSRRTSPEEVDDSSPSEPKDELKRIVGLKEKLAARLLTQALLKFPPLVKLANSLKTINLPSETWTQMVLGADGLEKVEESYLDEFNFKLMLGRIKL